MVEVEGRRRGARYGVCSVIRSTKSTPEAPTKWRVRRVRPYSPFFWRVRETQKQINPPRYHIMAYTASTYVFAKYSTYDEGSVSSIHVSTKSPVLAVFAVLAKGVWRVYLFLGVLGTKYGVQKASCALARARVCARLSPRLFGAERRKPRARNRSGTVQDRSIDRGSPY